MGVYMVTHLQRWVAQECRNVYYYETTVGEPSDSEWKDCVDEIRADYVAEFTGHLSDEWEFYGIERRRVDTAGLLSFLEVPTAGKFIGTATADTLPTQIAMLVGVKGTTTKPNRARTYLAGWTENAVTDSLFLAAPRSAAQTFIDLQAVLNAAGTNPLQRVAAQWNTSHTQVINQNWISTSFGVASEVPATQRRRRIGVGI